VDTVRKLLNVKGQGLWSIVPDASVYDAIEMMADKGCGALAVMTGADLVGIISERDYARKVILAGRSSKTTLVNEIMTAPVITGSPDATVEGCLALMTDKRIRHLPITEGATVLGMVSIGDLVKAIIAEQKFLISQLESYIKQ